MMSVVSIVRSKYTDESRVAEMVHSVLKPLGGLGTFVSANDRVLLKPNLVTNRKYFTGATTDPLIVEAVIHGLKQLGVYDIVVADSSWTGCPTERAFNATGMTPLCKREDVELLDLKKDRYEKVKITAGDELDGTVEIASSVLEADKIINLPKLKAHCQTRVTLALKNLKGCITDDEKRRFHRLNLDEGVAELNTVLKPDLIVLDAIVGEMTAELGCDPIRLDTVVAGVDPVAVDAVCATMLGYGPEEIEHIGYADQMGGGTGLDLAGVELVGDVELAELKEAVKAPVGFARYEEAFKQYGIDIVEDGACSSCLAALYIALKRAADDEALEELKGKKIFIGQNAMSTYTHVVNESGNKGNCVGVGNCLDNGDRVDDLIAGCPPTALKIFKHLTGSE
jgi:uncharacterized protein (DUF362 family)